MNRRDFLLCMGALGLTGVGMNIFKNFKSSSEQPLLFIGHGSPMNAIEQNEFSDCWRQIGSQLTPQAILVVSAHWETYGSQVHGGVINKTIHDFYGFPQELFNVQYPAPANVTLAQEIQKHSNNISLTDVWGLDHGAWSVLVNMFPQANIPVIQLSLNKNLNLQAHWDLANQLKFLRSKGVLIIGSGNIVHNLRTIQWQNPKPFDWAEDIQNKIIQNINNHDYEKVLELVNYPNFAKAHPSVEHFLPLIYSLGLSNNDDQAKVFTPKIELGSISMASFLLSK